MAKAKFFAPTPQQTVNFERRSAYSVRPGFETLSGVWINLLFQNFLFWVLKKCGIASILPAYRWHFPHLGKCPINRYKSKRGRCLGAFLPFPTPPGIVRQSFQPCLHPRLQEGKLLKPGGVNKWASDSSCELDVRVYGRSALGFPQGTSSVEKVISGEFRMRAVMHGPRSL